MSADGADNTYDSLSYGTIHDVVMTPISVRLDDDALSALRLLRNRGLNASEAIRMALLEAAETRRSSAALRAEAAALNASADDRREMAAIRDFFDDEPS